MTIHSYSHCPMKTDSGIVPRLLCATAALLVLACCMEASHAADMKLEAQLIWGTNDAQSPDPRHKPAEPGVQRKLKSLPFKFANYFEVNRQAFTVSPAATKRVTMSKECVISVKHLGDTKVEVQLFGRGEPVSRITQALPKGELLVIGGNAPNFTAWFVVLRQVD